MKTFTTFLLSLLIGCGSCVPTYVFDDTHGVGRTFDGIGGLSGGGATSKLLVNYGEEQRSQILDYLFKPNFGASLQILKVEIGGDVQSTDGTEASHMHNSWDENYNRGYEWWLMKEAKKRNPNIRLYGLPWGFPGWLAGKPQDPYFDAERTSVYILKWILGARAYHNLTIDYVGIWNERNYDINYIKTLRKVLDANKLTNVKIVAADGNWGIASDMLKDRDLANAVDYIGAHYPGTVSNIQAIKTGKQLWSSEDYSTFNDNIGAGCWARILNQNYVNGYMTSTISWNLIASYYNTLPFYRDGLMTAVEPWSGHYAVEGPIWMTAHITQFTDIGWTYLNHGQGVGLLANGGSYVSLVSPDRKDITIIIETMSHNHSLCIRPGLKPYTVNAGVILMQFNGSFAGIRQLESWYSKPTYHSGGIDTYFKRESPVMIESGQVYFRTGIDEVWTLTTLKSGLKGMFPVPPPSKPFPVLYTDSFESYKVSMEPNNLAQQTGSFEVVAEDGNQFVRQMVLEQPLTWCSPAHLLNKSISIIGEHSWVNVSITADVRLSPVNGTSSVMLAARVDKAGCQLYDTGGMFFFVFPRDGFYILSSDLDRKEIVATGNVDNFKQGWNTIELKAWNNGVGDYASGYVNGKMVMSSLGHIKWPQSGFAGIGTDTWGLADFDNLVISQSNRP